MEIHGRTAGDGIGVLSTSVPGSLRNEGKYGVVSTARVISLI